MTFQKEQLDDFRIRATVELAKEDLSQYIAKAERELARDANIKGFRKGKAPVEKIRETLGADAIRETAMQSAIEGGVSAFLREHALEVINQRDLKILENSADRLQFSLELTLMPHVVLGAFTKRSIPKKFS